MKTDADTEGLEARNHLPPDDPKHLLKCSTFQSTNNLPVNGLGLQHFYKWIIKKFRAFCRKAHLSGVPIVFAPHPWFATLFFSGTHHSQKGCVRLPENTLNVSYISQKSRWSSMTFTKSLNIHTSIPQMHYIPGNDAHRNNLMVLHITIHNKRFQAVGVLNHINNIK